jgi:hypothetical protein
MWMTHATPRMLASCPVMVGRTPVSISAGAATVLLGALIAPSVGSGVFLLLQGTFRTSDNAFVALLVVTMAASAVGTTAVIYRALSRSSGLR